MATPPVLRQSASNSVCRYEARTATVTFTDPTVEKNLLILTVSLAGGSSTSITVPSGWVLVRNVTSGYMQLAMYYREGAPTTNSVQVTIGNDRSMHLRVTEYANAAQSNALDRVTVLYSQAAYCDTGSSGTIGQADEVVVAVVANRHASTTQSGFVGGLARLFETVTPQYYGRYGSNEDSERHRCTHHESIAKSISVWRLYCYLSSARDWVAILATFRGGSSGPKRMTSTNPPPMLSTGGGGGVLTAFGPLKSSGQSGPIFTTGGTGGSARILPFVYQFSMNGLLTGESTPYDVVSHDGLYGWDVRQSDDDQPRGDGALRGVDLQSARQVLFKLDIGGSEQEVEQLLAVLYRTLTPQRDTDWELVWRHPAGAARMLRCRPISLPRQSEHDNTKLSYQNVVLRAANPRHYSAIAKRIEVPNTPAGASSFLQVTANNAGNIAAYPQITIVGPTSGPPVSRVELVNETALITFDVALTLPAGRTLVGDMEANVTGAPRSTITLDGATKYGAWQLPRNPFRIDPDPLAVAGDNVLHLRTEPPGAPVTAVLDYRDTWAG